MIPFLKSPLSVGRRRALGKGWSENALPDGLGNTQGWGWKLSRRLTQPSSLSYPESLVSLPPLPAPHTGKNHYPTWIPCAPPPHFSPNADIFYLVRVFFFHHFLTRVAASVVWIVTRAALTVRFCHQCRIRKTIHTRQDHYRERDQYVQGAQDVDRQIGTIM